MNASSIIALRKAVRDHLLADSAITAMTGPAGVYDEAPPGASPPYITFADVRSRDWSTASDDGAEHTLALDVWSRQRGLADVLQLASAISVRLDDAPLQPDGHRLVSMFLVGMESRRESRGRFARVRMAWRAITESL